MNATIFPIGRQMILATTLLAFLSACQTANDAAKAPLSAASTGEMAATPSPAVVAKPSDAEGAVAVVMLSGDEIRSLLVGNTAISIVTGDVWKEYYREDGLIRGREDAGRYTGKWSISGNAMRFDYERATYDETLTMGRDTKTDEIVAYRGGQEMYRFRVVPGNSHGL